MAFPSTLLSAQTIPRPTRAVGFTLIEMLVTILVLGILTAIAVPSYQTYVRQASRAEAKGILMETAQALERNYTLANRYDRDSAGTAITLPFATSPKPGSGTAKYNITAAYGAAPAQTFILSATPTGSMAGDQCGTLTLNQAGLTGSALDNATCWQR